MKLSYFLKIHFVFLSVIHLHKVSGLKCYACSITSSNSDQTCLYDPLNSGGQSVVTCNKKYCTIFRQELKDPVGKINSFVRGCEEEPTLLNEVIEDRVFKTYYRSCSSDLCNDGDGLKEPGGIKISAEGSNRENMLVPGLPNASTSIKAVFNISRSGLLTILILMKMHLF